MDQNLRARIRQFNKHLTNRLTMRFAGSSHTFFAIVRHKGRRSGKVYETPIIVEPVAGGFVIALTYGPNVDWYRNVTAAGHCQIRWHNRDYAVDHIEPIDMERALLTFAGPLRPILRTLGTREFVQMSAQVID